MRKQIEWQHWAAARIAEYGQVSSSILQLCFGRGTINKSNKEKVVRDCRWFPNEMNPCMVVFWHIPFSVSDPTQEGAFLQKSDFCSLSVKFRKVKKTKISKFAICGCAHMAFCDGVWCGFPPTSSVDELIWFFTFWPHFARSDCCIRLVPHMIVCLTFSLCAANLDDGFWIGY